jgi:signal peptidase I
MAARIEDDAAARTRFVIPRPGEVILDEEDLPDILKQLLERDGQLSRRSGDGGPRLAGMPPHASVVRSEFYFLLGDRPAQSVDSRGWGLVPRAWIVGTPVAVYWSADPGSTGFSGWLGGIRWSRLGHVVR